MLQRIAQREKIAPGFFQPVAYRNEFFPTVDRNEPVVSQVTNKFLRVLESEVGDIAIGPDKRMKRLDIDGRVALFFATINAHRAGLAEFNRDNPGRFVGAEKEFVILESHRRRWAT